jgi:phosphohistidine phosphatase SixA
MLTKRFLIAATMTFILAGCHGPQRATIILRHAEKAAGNGDVPLSPAGMQRRQRLVYIFGDTAISEIIVSSAARARDTVRPLAEARKIPITQIGQGDNGALLRRLRHGKPGTRLVVWHAKLIPDVVAGLSGMTVPYADDEYDRIVIIAATGETIVVRMDH